VTLWNISPGNPDHLQSDLIPRQIDVTDPVSVHRAIFDQMTETHFAYMKSKIPMGRFGTVEEIAAMACWLASGEASFTTGAVFDRSGGRATC
jgi:3-oxoacyl-[acyl-carrier protein] reductase